MYNFYILNKNSFSEFFFAEANLTIPAFFIVKCKTNYFLKTRIAVAILRLCLKPETLRNNRFFLKLQIRRIGLKNLIVMSL